MYRYLMGKSQLEQLAKEALMPRGDHKADKNQSWFAVTKEGEHHPVMDKQQWQLRDVQSDSATLLEPGKVLSYFGQNNQKILKHGL